MEEEENRRREESTEGRIGVQKSMAGLQVAASPRMGARDYDRVSHYGSCWESQKRDPSDHDPAKVEEAAA